MNEYNNVIIENEDGTSSEYEVLAIFEVDDNSYIALLPVDNESECITFFGCTEKSDTNELELVVIESEEEFGLVSNSFVALMEDYAENGM